jgi:AcrR family transcriptional regulator
MRRTSRDDVVAAAGRLFAARGYEGTSMRDLGKELGLLGSSLYSHVGSKQDLLVEVIRRGAGFFQESVERAAGVEGTAADRLRAMIAGHIDVVLDHRDEVGTYLNEARSLDDELRRQVLDARNRYEDAFRTVLKEGAADGSIRLGTDPALGAIFILSILNAIDRWFSLSGTLSREELVDEVYRFVLGSAG